jgi:D-alanyl-D-alanine carboxypeptidase
MPGKANIGTREPINRPKRQIDTTHGMVATREFFVWGWTAFMSERIASIRLISPCLRAAGLLATLMIVGASWDQAEARSPRNNPPKHVIHGPNYHPPYAAIVVDDKSGLVLHEVDADEPRHPASLTKIMTLYLLFEQLEGSKLRLDTPLAISTRAALQPPTKLGLKANQTIKVEDAIKGLVTKSANDAAVVVAEAIGGSEGEFARLMTVKARALGMTSTTYVNASGLPADEQITTARDQALLGRAIQARFPVYYRYFATPSFQYKGVEMHNHNSLLGQVRGVDGIKTGYTEASGYNLVSSVRRDEKHIVAVVLGGTSNAVRDERMRQLIEDHIFEASTQRTAPIIAEANSENSAQEGGAVVAPETRNWEPPTGKRLDATLALAKAQAASIPKFRHSVKRPANTSNQARGGKAPSNQAQQLTANATNKVSRLKALRDASTSASRQIRKADPYMSPSASMNRHF